MHLAPDLRRTWLFGPGADPAAHAAMAACGADVLIMDLEDFTQPARRPAARAGLGAVLQAWRAAGAMVCVHAENHGMLSWMGRRLVEKGVDLRSTVAQQVMHPRPSTVARDALAVEAAELMEHRCITSVLVLDAQGRLCGALNSNDLMRAKVI